MARKVVRAAALLALMASSPALSKPFEPARFDWFRYHGNDRLPHARANEYANPILQGFYPDPSIVRVGHDYYLVNSTFAWFPGIPVFHSRDLVHWTQIGNAIDRGSQLKLDRLSMAQGLYAPDISWHDGTFYIVNTCIGCRGNFVITAKHAQGPWSDPTWLPNVDGIDPSLFFDDDGRAWLVHNGPPAGRPRYEGHTAIWLQEFDPKGLEAIGEPKLLVDGGVHPEQNPIWIEGPHIFKKDGAYYLIAAEGGTGENHSEVVFRSDQVAGPYAPLASNPILTQRDLPANRTQPITSTGHAKFVDTPAGDWWAVFLGVRPYDSAGDFNTGRETFLMPVQWRDGWPRITGPGQLVPWIGPDPKLPLQSKPAIPTSGAFSLVEDFHSQGLPLYWMTLRGPGAHWSRIRNGALELDPRKVGIGDLGNPSFVARRQQHINAVATTKLRFRPSDPAAEAGLVAFQNDEHWYFLAVGAQSGMLVLRLRARTGLDQSPAGNVLSEAALGVAPGTPVEVRISATGAKYDFSWSVDGSHWQTLFAGADGTVLSTTKAGGFVGAVFGMYAHEASGDDK